MTSFNKFTTVIKTEENKHLIFPFLKSLGGKDRHNMESLMEVSALSSVSKYYIGGVHGDTIIAMYHDFGEDMENIVEIPKDFKI
jgi:hypothetical protein